MIQSLSVLNIWDDGATINWTTDVPADGLVEYGPTTAYGQQFVDGGLFTQHWVNLVSLSPGTTYHYRVHSRDATGAVTVTPDLTFTTTGVAPLPPPALGAPELPRVFLDTAYVQPEGRSFMVNPGSDLQFILNQAQPGDIILLTPGTFTGNYVLPNKTGTGWITIHASTLEQNIPQGIRVTPAQAGFMPKIVSPNSDPAIQTAPGAHRFRFVGIEFGVAPGVDIYNIVAFGGDQTAPADTPHDLIIDRCYIHGNAVGNARRGVLVNSANTAIIDSYISDIHEVGADSQAVCGWNGPGPFKIVNNYLEGAGENVMFGGAPPSLPNLIASDIEFRNNHIAKPLSWKKGDPTYAGQPWTVKNLFELKNAQRVLVDKNVFENNWADAQNGFAILFTPRSEVGVAPWATAADVTFTNNIVRHSGSGFNVAGPDDVSPSQPTQRVLIKNNLVYDIDGNKWGSVDFGPADGRALQTIGGPVNIAFDHNTFQQTGAIIVADVAPSPGFVFRNNIAPHNDYGVMGSGVGVGQPALDHYFPGVVFQKNVIIAVPDGVTYPPDNFTPASLDFAAGTFTLPANSPYINAGTDGLTIGASLTLS